MIFLFWAIAGFLSLGPMAHSVGASRMAICVHLCSRTCIRAAISSPTRQTAMRFAVAQSIHLKPV